MLKTNSFTLLQHAIIIDKATEKPFTGKYPKEVKVGTYLCRQCGIALFRADNQFDSSCGWPSFDDEIKGNVTMLPDVDGRRTEIVCSHCKGHLGHVFSGENHTAKNTRYCVNAASVDFVPHETVLFSSEIFLAAGCFWGVEYYLQKLPGVLKTEVGYSGGHVDKPSYQEVCSKTTGHLEVVRVVFDESVLSLEKLLKYFFEIHDFSQQDGQGPDLGNQYLSAIFCYDEKQKQVARDLIALLESKGKYVATTVRDVTTFWVGEDYHQDYYNENASLPYCHAHKALNWDC